MGFLPEKKKDKNKVEKKEVVETKVEEKPKEKVLEPTKRFMVVKELPVQPIKEFNDEETNELVTILTIEEALESLLNKEEK